MFTKSSFTIDFIEDETTHKITDPQQICDLFNDIFTSVMTKTDPIDSEIPIPGPTPETLLSDFTITEEEVRKHLRLLKWNKSSGPDGIQVNVMKKCHNMIPWLCKLYEKSLRTGHCPHDWKDAHMLYTNKYVRCSLTISLTSQVVKLMEIIVLEKLWEHLLENDLINTHQHGFQFGRSCVTNC